MRRERAVLAVQRHVRESESVRLREKVTRRRTHRESRIRRAPCRIALEPRRRLLAALLMAALAGRRLRHRRERARPERGRHAAARLPAQCGPRRDLHSRCRAATTGARASRLAVRRRRRPTDAVKLLVAGRADLAILDIHDLALARERGRDLVGVMALVQTPAGRDPRPPTIRTPRDLEGRRVGVTGLPSDAAVLRSIVDGDGGDPRKVVSTTIGFEAVRSAADRARRAATGVLERRGRGAARAPPAASASSASTTTARRPTPSSCWRDPHDARRTARPLVRATVAALRARLRGGAQRPRERASAR